ncbi:hypothetical protein SteCoe_16391 [Stentor coeruleus]|uniref:Enoyl reductase (ER) domain-containing protein n=1 Tax=Stentor coeruleus TaxID=5963 RepID=A0A1R2C1I7_9CILI|nr:hypothetical protein SteCoe_16391 [Stentor coeruleus]
MASSYEILGDRASIPCDVGSAHGVALLTTSAGLDFEYSPFRHPSLLDKEVRIKVTHSGCCQTDTFMMKNGWGATNYPFVGGHETFGIVTHIGEKVTDFQIGDRVGHGWFRNYCTNCSICRAGNTQLCDTAEISIVNHFGGWATSYQSNQQGFYKLPDSMPGSAAPIMCAGATVYSPFKRDLVSGMKVGVVGIGGLGHLALMFAKNMGCEVTAISTSPSKEPEAREFGADHFLNSRDPEAIKRNERTLDYIIDTAIAPTLDTQLRLLKPRGIVTVVGLPEGGQNPTLNAFSIVTKDLTVKGSAAGSRSEIESMLEFCGLHSIYPKSEIYQFGNARAAIDSLGASIPRAPRYRAVLETASYFDIFTPSN